MLTVDKLRDMLRDLDPAALLVDPWVLRRVIRLDRRLAGLGFHVPHRKTYTIDRGRLLAFVDRAELELAPEAELPRTVILLAKPTEDESLDLLSTDEALRNHWRLLFHSRAHVELDRRLAENPSKDAIAEQRRATIGEAEFDEIRAVLLKDELLFPNPSTLETYVEFAAIYLELRYFAPLDLPIYFPAIRDWIEVDRIVSQDVYHSQLFEATRLGTVSAQTVDELPAALTAGASQSGPAASGAEGAREFPSFGKSRKLQARAARASQFGNLVRAAILHTAAARWAPAERAAECRVQARAELTTLVARLGQALSLPTDELAAWIAALEPLLEVAGRTFWSAEMRLLYDLQKVCIEHERGVFRLDPIGWITSLGQSPLRKPLPLLRDVLTTKHLRTAERRLAISRLATDARERLARLIAAALDRTEEHSRGLIRPLIDNVFDEVGLVPQNIPEKVARRKLVEELLDTVTEHGAVGMGQLRDALSKSDLKLPDVSGPVELGRGDRLLRADRRLATVLDGVYRPGAIYLRGTQRLSSLAFGTRLGRLVTRYAALPFGIAFLLLEFLRYLLKEHFLPRSPFPQWSERLESGVANWVFWGAVLALGGVILLLMHAPRFRTRLLAVLATAWWGAKLLASLPSALIRLPWVQRLLHSPAYAALRGYVLRPALFATLTCVVSWIAGWRTSPHVALELFLAYALFLNSPIGRHADEWLTDLIVQTFEEFRIRVLAATFQWVMDVFHRLLTTIERIMHALDEWFRFRVGDNPLVNAVKFVGGVVWFFISYLVVLISTLLIEPQVNPIKHFPVVTVAHKLIFPAAPFVEARLRARLEQYTNHGLAKTTARTVVWSTIWLIPGIPGFLVWELRENWRLYAANRSRTLTPVPIGHHRETMVGLLRWGFHSGTFPKLFAKLRRASRKAHRTGDWKTLNRHREALRNEEKTVLRFVQRELCALLEEARFREGRRLLVREVHVSTARAQAKLSLDDPTRTWATLACRERDGRLVGTLDCRDGLESLSSQDREAFVAATMALFQRAGVEEVEGLVAGPATTPILWSHWSTRWRS